MRALLAIALSAAFAAVAEPRLVDATAPDSARPAALAMLRHLSEGNIAEAAALSNAPRRRFEVLRDYRDAVGEDEFKRIFGRYFAAENRVVAEHALGRHRLLVWDLGEAGHHMTGQYYVEVEGKFLLDDVPGPERAQLRRVLESYRKAKP